MILPREINSDHSLTVSSIVSSKEVGTFGCVRPPSRILLLYTAVDMQRQYRLAPLPACYLQAPHYFKPDNIMMKYSLRTPTLQPTYLSLAGREQPWSSRRIRTQDFVSEGVVLTGTRRCHFHL